MSLLVVQLVGVISMLLWVFVCQNYFLLFFHINDFSHFIFYSFFILTLLVLIVVKLLNNSFYKARLKYWLSFDESGIRNENRKWFSSVWDRVSVILSQCLSLSLSPLLGHVSDLVIIFLVKVISDYKLTLLLTIMYLNCCLPQSLFVVMYCRLEVSVNWVKIFGFTITWLIADGQ